MFFNKKNDNNNELSHVENPNASDIFMEYKGEKITYGEMKKVLGLIEELNLDVESNGIDSGFRHNKILYTLK